MKHKKKQPSTKSKSGKSQRKTKKYPTNVNKEQAKAFVGKIKKSKKKSK